VNVIGAALELVGTSEGAPIRTIGDAEENYQGYQGDIIEPNVLGDGTAGLEPVARAPITDLPLTDTLAGVDVLGSFAVDGDEEPDWQENALCAQTDPEAFFPEKGGSTREAKRICSGCDVRAECLEYALAHDERFGIWGGLSERERRRLRREAAS
jgi:WhiB family transcriptional regulator, redox-sensing transcriptional regulator